MKGCLALPKSLPALELHRSSPLSCSSLPAAGFFPYKGSAQRPRTLQVKLETHSKLASEAADATDASPPSWELVVAS